MKNFTIKQKVIFVIVLLAVLTVVLGAIFIWQSNSNSVHPDNLGNRLQYLGSHNSSCDILGQIVSMGFCSPQYQYFFATDMSVDDLKSYFVRAKNIDVQNYFDEGAMSGAQLQYQLEGYDDFYVFYYDSSAEVTKQYNLKQSSKAHIVAIRDFYLSVARASLK